MGANSPKTPISRARFAYDFIKFISRHFIPVVGSTYFAVATVWGFEESFAILGVLLVVQMILGFILSILAEVFDLDRRQYVGDIVVREQSDGKKVYRLELESDAIGNLDEKREVTFRIKND